MRASAAGRAPGGEAEPGNGSCGACGASAKPFPRRAWGNWGNDASPGVFPGWVCWGKYAVS